MVPSEIPPKFPSTIVDAPLEPYNTHTVSSLLTMARGVSQFYQCTIPNQQAPVPSVHIYQRRGWIVSTSAAEMGTHNGHHDKNRQHSMTSRALFFLARQSPFSPLFRGEHLLGSGAFTEIALRIAQVNSFDSQKAALIRLILVHFFFSPLATREGRIISLCKGVGGLLFIPLRRTDDMCRLKPRYDFRHWAAKEATKDDQGSVVIRGSIDNRLGETRVRDERRSWPVSVRRWFWKSSATDFTN